MNDGYRGQRGHGPYEQDPYSYGYDPYAQQGYDYDQGGGDPGYQQGYQDQAGTDGYGYAYDPYGGAQQQPHPQQTQAHPQQQYYAQQAPPHAHQQATPQAPAGPAGDYGYGYDPYGPAASTGEQGRIPQQRPPEQHPPREYETEQFAFVEDDPESSEDVIDWLKFTESRTERREEAKRRGRNRKIALLLVAVLAVLGGTGYMWATDRLGFLPGSGSEAAVAEEEKRDTIVVHLHDTDGGGTATALLVDNATTEQGTTVLLPNDLAVSGDDGSAMPLGDAVDEQGAGATRDAIDTLLGSQIKGSWRLDTPYLEILVEGVGGITVDADVTVPGAKDDDGPLVEKGKASINGRAAIAYATYLAKDEPQTAQLERFGQVMQALLKKLPSDTAGVKGIVKSVGMISDPSLSEAQLAASLAGLADRAKEGAYATEMLAVDQDGRPSQKATAAVVEDVLGGTVKSPEGQLAARVSVLNATGSADPAESAKVALVNGGFTFVDGGKSKAADASKVFYAEAAAKEQAVEVAKTLGLPEKAVTEGETAANAQVTVVLGQDYEG